MTTPDEIIKLLDLIPHPEGGPIARRLEIAKGVVAKTSAAPIRH